MMKILTEDELDLIAAEEAYKEYVESGCKSVPAAEFWKALDDEDVKELLSE